MARHDPLSYGQERIWFLQRLEPESRGHVLQHRYRLLGPLDRVALEDALRALAERHGILRSRFLEEDGTPVQVSEEAPLPAIPCDDIEGLDPNDRDNRLRQVLEDEQVACIDLARGPVLRLRLVRVGVDEHLLVRTAHHIAFDGWSEAVFNRELSYFYGWAVGQSLPPLPRLSVQYGEYARWQRRQRAGLGHDSMAYWAQQLAGAPTDSLFAPPGRHDRGSGPRDGWFRRDLPQARVDALRSAARAHRVTLHICCMAAYGAALATIGGRADVTIGMPVADRPHRAFEDLIGYFVNVLPIRMRVSPNAPVQELLAETRQVVIEAFRHAVPFEHLVRELAPARHADVHPIFEVSLAFQNLAWHPLALAGLDVQRVGAKIASRYDVDLYVTETPAGADLLWVYDAARLDPARVRAFADEFDRRLASLVTGPDTTVRERTARAGDRAAVRHEAGGEGKLSAETYPELFERQAVKTPDAVALIHDGGSWTYDTLNRTANRLARILVADGARPEAIVGILMERTTQLVVALLATMKAGAGYLPLDPEYPDRRLGLMIADTSPLCVLTTRRLVDRVPAGVRAIALDDPAFDQRCRSTAEAEIGDAERASALTCEHSAYVVYTSGSTGMPKGVVGLHKGLVNRVEWFNACLGAHDDGPALAMTSISFIDGSTELFGPLAQGRAVVLSDTPAASSMKQIGSLVERHAVAQVTVGPSTLAALLDENPPEALRSCRRWISSGETLPRVLAERVGRVCPNAQLINLYGMSEASGDSLWHVCDDEVMLGRPIWNTQVFLLDEQFQPVPIGAVGEVYLAGHGLARGYLNQPRLTAARFLPNPFGVHGSRMYRTGDLGRLRADGRLELAGRADRQIKIRGVRIEPGEVEAAIAALDGVREVAVDRNGDELGSPRLAAYISCSAGTAYDSRTLRRALGPVLPPSLIPSLVVRLDSFPRLPNGKVDWQALRRVMPVDDDAGRGDLTEEEQILCGIFADLFKQTDISPDDDFFELGGHSMQALRLISRLAEAFDVEVPVRAVFETSRIADLAEVCAALRRPADEPMRKDGP